MCIVPRSATAAVSGVALAVALLGGASPALATCGLQPPADAISSELQRSEVFTQTTINESDILSGGELPIPWLEDADTPVSSPKCPAPSVPANLSFEVIEDVNETPVPTLVVNPEEVHSGAGTAAFIRRAFPAPQVKPTLSFSWMRSADIYLNGDPESPGPGQRLLRFEDNDVSLHDQNGKLSLIVGNTWHVLFGSTKTTNMIQAGDRTTIEITLDAVEDTVRIRIKSTTRTTGHYSNWRELTLAGATEGFSLRPETAVRLGDLSSNAIENGESTFDSISLKTAEVFSPNSFWRTEVTDAATHAFSDERAHEFKRQRDLEGAHLQTKDFTPSVYVVPAGHAAGGDPRAPLTPVTLYNGARTLCTAFMEPLSGPCPGGDPQPCQTDSFQLLFAQDCVLHKRQQFAPARDQSQQPPGAALREILASEDGRVPLPDIQSPSDVDTDAPVAIYQPSGSVLFDFWRFRSEPDPRYHSPSFVAQSPFGLGVDANPAWAANAEAEAWDPQTPAGHGVVDGPSAQGGGRMVGVRNNRTGHFRNLTDENGTQSEHSDWGATAAKLPLLGGLVTITDLKTRRIDHAIGVAIPRASKVPMNRQGTAYLPFQQLGKSWVWPAQNTDGKVDGLHQEQPGVYETYRQCTTERVVDGETWSTNVSGCIPEGTRFRIKSEVACGDPQADGLSNKEAAIRTLCVAGKRYGFVVWDQSGEIAIRLEKWSGDSDDDPYRPNGQDSWADGLLGDWPSVVAGEFWDRILNSPDGNGLETLVVGTDNKPNG